MKSKKSIENKIKYHKKKLKIFKKELSELEQKEKRIGFRWYD